MDGREPPDGASRVMSLLAAECGLRDMRFSDRYCRYSDSAIVDGAACTDEAGEPALSSAAESRPGEGDFAFDEAASAASV